MTAPPPEDDLARNLEIARPEDPALVHLAVVGDTYTVLLAEFGDPVPTRTSPAPPLSDAERQERLQRAIAKAPEYGMEILPPPGT